jgi:uncharacterized protein (TIGR04141 family)
VASLSVYLIKKEITDPDKIIVKPKKRRVIPLLELSGYATVFVEKQKMREPDWVSYFGENEELKEIRLLSGAPAAVLLMQVKDRFFAIMFGYGSHLLEDGVTEARFGLRVVLNSVEATQLRSIDHKRLDGVPRNTREQLSKAGGLDQFGLNVERDLLRALTGRPAEKLLSSLLTGRDQLVVGTRPPLTDLANKLGEYLTLSESKDYLKTFPWVDNIAEISDTYLQAALDEKVVSTLSEGESPSVWLAAPEILDWTSLGGFRYGKKDSSQQLHEDLDLSLYFTFRKQNDITLQALKRDKVFHWESSADNPRNHWSVYNCLVAELTHENSQYILSEGRWYRIDNGFQQTVDDAIAAISASSAPLPAANLDEEEGAYNERTFQTGLGNFVLFHDPKKLVKYPGRGQVVEICDLYWKERAFIHVKHYGFSGKLSHLFSQGTVSAELFRSDPYFRKHVRAGLPDGLKSHCVEETSPQGDFEVGYAIICRKGKPLRLPFFSKVNLRNAASLLGAMGYRVTLTAIESK